MPAKVLPEPDESPLAGFALVDVDSGETFDLASRAGTGPLMLIFVTPTCPHCRAELRVISTMRGDFPDDAVRMLAVFPRGEADDVRAVLRDQWQVSGIAACVDESMELFDEVGVMSVPRSVLLDAGGDVARDFSGFPGADELAAALREVIG